MGKQFWYRAPLSLIGATVVAAALTAAATGTSSAGKPAGVLPLAVAASDVDYTDPALAYGVLSWEIEYETCSKLVDYSDANGAVSSELGPDAAAGMPAVSKNGLTYTFTIRSGIKFDDGSPVTAESFKATFDRDANPSMNSPVSAFTGDIVGWNDEVEKKASTVSGVVARGKKLTIHLTQKDGGLLDKLAMPFFCAIEPSKTPVDPQGLLTLPGSGPYYIASRTVGKQVVLKANPYYRGNRPHRSSLIVLTMNTNPQQTFLQVENGTYAADPSGLDNPAEASQLAKEYGVNKGRFFVHSVGDTDYWALNTSRPPFNNVALRQAANYAVDRGALTRIRGYLGAKATSNILPPNLGGGVDTKPLYPLSPNDKKAKSLAGGKCGNVNLWYQTGPIGTPQAGILRYNLTQIGCNVSERPFQGYAMYTAAGVKGADFDVAMSAWYQDYADGYDFFHTLLDGRTLQAANNNNLAYFNNAAVIKRINADNLLSGTARATAWGELDNYTMKNFAPWIPFLNRNQVDFVGPHTGGYLYAAPWGALDFGSLYLK